jgi:hypothetical protein
MKPQEPHDIRFEGGRGDTIKTAIVVRGARTDLEGTYAEYAWLVNRFGPKDKGWKLISHSHGVFGGRDIDTFTIQLADGTQRSVFFDSTESFGKF